MVENAEREPTIEEIVVALRETRQGVGRTPPLTVIDGKQRGESQAITRRATHDSKSAITSGQDVGREAQNETGPAETGDLRGDEIGRLLTENARLNERIVSLLNIIERERTQRVAPPTNDTDRGPILRDLKIVLEAELRPFLLVLLRLMEKQRDPAGFGMQLDGRKRPAAANPEPGMVARSTGSLG
jgi:hypothetical protein